MQEIPKQAATKQQGRLIVHMTFDEASSIISYLPQINTEGAILPPFSIPLQLTYKGKRQTVTVYYGENLDGSFYAYATPPNKHGLCVGCLTQLLKESRSLLWHLIQEKRKA